MFDGFHVLRAEVAKIIVLHVVPMLPTCGPVARVQYSPHEELAVGRGSCLTQFFRAIDGTLSKEESLVCRRRQVLLIS
jgi:hypothetical protein